MIDKEVTIENKLGLHLRAAALLVKEAEKFSSDITLVKDKMKINAKSILGITTLMAKKGTKLKIVADGEDEAEAIESLEELFKNKFYEE